MAELLVEAQRTVRGANSKRSFSEVCDLENEEKGRLRDREEKESSRTR